MSPRAPRGRSPRAIRVLLVLALAAVVAAMTAPTAGAALYWAVRTGDFNSIGRVNLDGSHVEPQFVDARQPCGVAVTQTSVFWAGYPSEIRHADLDGSGAAAIVPQLHDPPEDSTPCGLATDATHLYWADDGVIDRSKLDGTELQRSFISTSGSVWGVAVDGAHIYWTEGNFGGTTVGRANLDGSQVDNAFITGASSPAGIAVDGTHIYWSNSGDGTIGRANLDGTSVNQSYIAARAASAIGGPLSIAIDTGHIYWDELLDATPRSTIGRATIDGANVEHDFVVSPGGLVRGLAVDARRISLATLQATPAQSTFGTPLALTATVAPTSLAGPPAPTGTVRFTANGQPIGAPVPIDGSGSAGLAPEFYFDVGDTVRALYSGDATYLPAASTLVPTGISAAKTETTLQLSPNPVVSGSGVDFVIHVSNLSTAITPFGSIRVLIDGQFLGNFALYDNGGLVGALQANVPAGDYRVEVSYRDDTGTPPDFLTSGATQIAHVITAPAAPSPGPGGTTAPMPSTAALSPSSASPAPVTSKALARMVSLLVRALRTRGFGALAGRDQLIASTAAGRLTQRVYWVRSVRGGRAATVKPVLIASGDRRLAAGQVAHLRLRATSAGRHAFKRGSRLTIRVVTSFAPQVGVHVQYVRSFAIRPPTDRAVSAAVGWETVPAGQRRALGPSRGGSR